MIGNLKPLVHTLICLSIGSYSKALIGTGSVAARLNSGLNPGLLSESSKGNWAPPITESWELNDRFTYSLFESFFRAQGLACSPNNQPASQPNEFWFSSWTSLAKAQSTDGSMDDNSIMAIPDELRDLGDNHIGDIDYADGKIYAGIEDGPDYLHPYVGVFNSSDLSLLRFAPLPQALQADGVPWVAIDPESKSLIAANYGSLNRLNFYDLTNFSLVAYLKTSETLHNVQGAKVYNGSLYLTADYLNAEGRNEGYSIYRINLKSGNVQEVAHFPQDLVEVEGLCFSTDPQGIKILALGVIPFHDSDLANELRLRQMVLHSFRPKPLSK